MSQALAGKVALITGGSKGIGAATAQLFSTAGASVAINYSSDTTAANDLVSTLGGDTKALAIQADAGSLSGGKQMVDATVKKFGKIDILVLNAGVLPMKDLMSTTEADFDKTYNLNVKGPYFLAQAAVPHMPTDGSGRIIFVSTSLTINTMVPPPYLLYNSTKGAIEQMTRVMSKELAAKHKIVVNCVAPGPTATELFLKGKSEDMLKMIKSWSPFNKLGEPNEVAEAFLFLASEGSRWVGGQTLYVNGAAMV